MKGLYIHIPFCTKKCSYCDFVSFAGMEQFLCSYVERLKSEALLYKGEGISTVFLGGGTPSLLEIKQISDLMAHFGRVFDIASGAEITIECNPASLSLDKLKAYKASGINRISVGAQSLSDSVLKKIGRCHTLQQLENAVESIKKAGFDSFNLDLIFALPGQTVEMWRNTLTSALEFEPKHISCYSLTIDENTPLGRAYSKGEIVLPTEDEERQMYYLTAEMLKNKGIKQYEISNYAVPGYECKHNESYWLCREYIGLGCAAHSFYNSTRFHNTVDFNKYMNEPFSRLDEIVLSDTEYRQDRIIFGLRMNKGVRLEYFAGFEKALNDNINSGMLRISDNFVSLTDYGRDFCDRIALDFL